MDFDPTIEALRKCEGLNSIAIVPIRAFGNVIASLNMASHGHVPLTPLVQSALESISAWISVSLIRLQAERERQEQAEQLKIQERRWSMAINATHDAIWEWNLVTNQTYYSPRWYQMLGYADQEFIMNFDTWKSLCHPDDFAHTVQLIQHVLDDPSSTGYQAEFRMKTKFDQWIWILGRGNVVQRSTDGTPILLSGTNTDITERKNAEAAREHLSEQLLQSQKMEAIGKLAGGIAHDFNNMLCVIIGQSDLALDRPSIQPQDRESFLAIQKAALHSADLTRQLLGFARKQTVLPRYLDLNQIVRDTIQMLRRLISENISLNWKPCTGTCMVKMDPSQIHQILTNLCVNARDSIDAQGQITIETMQAITMCENRARDLGCAAGRFVGLAVTDTGCGMTAEVQKHIFEPFFTTKPIGKGSGLGLSTVFGIVKKNQGAIEVTSLLGHGSTFIVFLPQAPDQTTTQKIDQHQTMKSNGETILVVEDEAPLVEIMSTMLTDVGYSVLTANSPKQAITLANTHKNSIDLLLTDVIMPEMNGYELYDIIHKTRPKLKCLYCSGYPSNILTKHGTQEANLHFLQKPFDQQVLTKAVFTALHSP